MKNGSEDEKAVAAAGAKVRFGNEIWASPQLTVSRSRNHPLNQRGKDVFDVSVTVIRGRSGTQGLGKGPLLS